MNRVGQFEKVSFEQFKKDYMHALLPGTDYKDLIEAEENALIQAYETIRLPVRATSGSAGYDFISPIDFMLNPGESITIPTGIRVKIDDGWFLGIYIRSSIGIKYETVISNGTGIIDSDYYNAKNCGHIFIKIKNDGDKVLCMDKGMAFAQGIFMNYGITYSDDTKSQRSGGIGSTNA